MSDVLLNEKIGILAFLAYPCRAQVTFQVILYRAYPCRAYPTGTGRQAGTLRAQVIFLLFEGARYFCRKLTS